MRCVMLMTVFLTGCTITVTPINKQHYYPRYVVRHHVHKIKSTIVKMVRVDPEWLEEYRKMEEEARYKIPGDDKIKTEDGKICVPQSVIDHFNDLSRVESTPKP